MLRKTHRMDILDMLNSRSNRGALKKILCKEVPLLKTKMKMMKRKVKMVCMVMKMMMMNITMTMMTIQMMMRKTQKTKYFMVKCFMEEAEFFIIWRKAQIKQSLSSYIWIQ